MFDLKLAWAVDDALSRLDVDELKRLEGERMDPDLCPCEGCGVPVFRFRDPRVCSDCELKREVVVLRSRTYSITELLAAARSVSACYDQTNDPGLDPLFWAGRLLLDLGELPAAIEHVKQRIERGWNELRYGRTLAVLERVVFDMNVIDPLIADIGEG